MECIPSGPTSLNDLPTDLFMSCILTTSYEGVKETCQSEVVDEMLKIKTNKKKRSSNSYFTSKELFMLRGVCGKWLDAVRITWCQIVKDEILDQVQSLDLLYEKETTNQLMEFKIKYLSSYAGLLQQYFVNINCSEVVNDIVNSGDERALIVILITCMIVNPDKFIPQSPNYISPELLVEACNYMKTRDFEVIYRCISQIDTIPKLNFQQMKTIKTDYIDRFLVPDTLSQLTNSARIMGSWLDAVLEFTVLKHEALILTVKKQNVIQKIKNVSLLWPKKKDFIERAYKILLFTKRVRPEINLTMMYLKKNNLYDFMNKVDIDKNKVYLRIKELEKRELKRDININPLFESTSERNQSEQETLASTNQEDEQTQPRRRSENYMPENVIREEEDENNEVYMNEENKQNEEIQTDQIEVEELEDPNILQDLEREQEPELLVRNCLCEHHRREIMRTLNEEINDEPITHHITIQEEEKKEIEVPEAQIEEVKEKPIYNSIRERYAKVLENEKQERERLLVQNNTVQNNSLQNNTDVQTEEQIPINILNNLRGGDQSAANTIPENIQGPAPLSQEEPEDERDAQGIIQLLSSQLLSQILSAGDLFHSHIAERFEREVETMKQKFYSLWFENILKVRIFLSDRHEKVERALQKCGFLPKNEEKSEDKDTVEQFDIEVVDLEALEFSLNDPSVLKQIYEYIMNDEENYE